MEREDGILPQRIEAGAFEGRRIEPYERIRCEQDEEQERRPQQSLHTERGGRQPIAAALRKRDETGIKREYEYPQHHRAFMIPPSTGDLVEQRLRGVGVLRDIENGEIGHDERENQRAERETNEYELTHRRARSNGARNRALRAGAPKSGEALHNRERQRETQCQLTDFARHVPPSFQRPARLSASTTSGGMYRSSCFASTSLARKLPPCSAPVATTPCPSRNRSGNAPEYSTGMRLRPSVTTNRTSAPGPRETLPFSTRPPTRKLTSGGTCFAAISDGL